MDNSQIKKRIKEILKDDRFLNKSATIFSNAPLALIQYGMEVELHTLQKVLGITLSDIKELRKE